jgi:hypothetical protein
MAVPMRHIGLGVAAFALLGLAAPQASACGWLWPCGDRPYATYRYGPPAYGYTSPARGYRYPYAAWPSTAIPPSQWYLGTALPGASTDSVGLKIPITSQQGLLEAGLPAKGPSLFGPNPAPPGWSYYNGGYYGTPQYGYYAFPSPVTPPRETASWWLEPRRRR